MATVLKGDLADLKKLQKQYTKIQKTSQASVSASVAKKTVTISQQDKAAFLNSIKGTVPLPSSNRLEPHAVPLQHPDYFKLKRLQAEGEPLFAPRKAKKTGAKHAPQPVHHPEQGEYLRSTDSADLLKKLRQGQWSIDATLDLHGNTQDEAGKRFDRFIQTCLDHEIKCVCIIHGQGHGSKQNRPVLKEVVRTWLRHHAHVTAYITAPDSMGGEGATLVLLSH